MKRVLGKVSKKIVENCNINEQKNVIYEETIKHSMERYIDDYKTVEDNSLEKIISNPDYVFYDKSKKD